MSEKENNEERLPELSETEKIHYEQMMVEMAFENSYKVITKKTTFKELLNIKGSFGQKAILIYNPDEGYDNLHLKDMINYFEEVEDYEKCAELKKILDEYI